MTVPYAPLVTESIDKSESREFLYAFRRRVMSVTKVGGFQGRKATPRTCFRRVSAIDEIRRRVCSLSNTKNRACSDCRLSHGSIRTSLRGTMVLGGRSSLRANGRYLTVGWLNTICCANRRTGGWNLFFDTIENPCRARSYTWDYRRLVHIYVDGISFRCKAFYFYLFIFFCPLAHAVICYIEIDRNGNCHYCFVLYFYPCIRTLKYTTLSLEKLLGNYIDCNYNWFN